MIILLIGISGSGKSTLGRELAKQLNYEYVDLDEYFKPNKPVVTLSNNQKVKNWDTLEAIDIEAFQQRISNLKNVIIVGFAITDKLVPKRDYCFHLNMGDRFIEHCINARRQSKGYIGQKAMIDELMVREYVVPFYLENLDKSTYIDIPVYKDNERRAIKDIVQEIQLAMK